MIWTVGHEEWGPILAYLAGIFGVLAAICFLWPLLRRLAIRTRSNADLTINEAIHYIGVDSKWAWTRSNVGGWQPHVRKLDHLVLLDAFEAFRKAAKHGIINVRGRAVLGTDVVPIEKDYWITAGIDPLSVIGKPITSGQTGTTHPGGMKYDTLIVSHDQIEKVWPRASVFYRRWTDIRFWFKAKTRCQQK